MSEKKLLFKGTLKHWNNIDIGMFKFSVFLFGLFVISVWPVFANFVQNTHWSLFLIGSMLFAIPPMIKYWKK
jgi:hypothetical protein